MKCGSGFACLLATVAVTLKQWGYRRKGNVFWSSNQACWKVIHFQRSTLGTAESTVFTVNLGTSSKALYRFLGKSDTLPTIEDCHWRQRIGFLLPCARDRWWTLDSSVDAASLSDEILDALIQFGMPALEFYSSNSALRDTWMAGNGPGLTEAQRNKFLSALLRIQG